MSTHNICFFGEIRKLLCQYLLLSGVMTYMHLESKPKSHFQINPNQTMQVHRMIRIRPNSILFPMTKQNHTNIYIRLFIGSFKAKPGMLILVQSGNKSVNILK